MVNPRYLIDAGIVVFLGLITLVYATRQCIVYILIRPSPKLQHAFHKKVYVLSLFGSVITIIHGLDCRGVFNLYGNPAWVLIVWLALVTCFLVVASVEWVFGLGKIILVLQGELNSSDSDTTSFQWTRILVGLYFSICTGAAVAAAITNDLRFGLLPASCFLCLGIISFVYKIMLMRKLHAYFVNQRSARSLHHVPLPHEQQRLDVQFKKPVSKLLLSTLCGMLIIFVVIWAIVILCTTNSRSVMAMATADPNVYSPSYVHAVLMSAYCIGFSAGVVVSRIEEDVSPISKLSTLILDHVWRLAASRLFPVEETSAAVVSASEV